MAPETFIPGNAIAASHILNYLINSKNTLRLYSIEAVDVKEKTLNKIKSYLLIGVSPSSL